MSGFESFVASEGQRLFRTALLLCGSRAVAEDAVQEVLLRALERWDKIAALESPRAYVRRMVVNEVTSGWRRTRGREVLMAELPASGHPHPGDPPTDGLAVRAACLNLPAKQRAAVVLRFYEDLSYEEIAQTVGCTQNAARVRVSRGVAKMREQLAEEEP